MGDWNGDTKITEVSFLPPWKRTEKGLNHAWKPQVQFG